MNFECNIYLGLWYVVKIKIIFYVMIKICKWMWNVKLVEYWMYVGCSNVYVNGYRECKILYVRERMGFGLLYSSFVRVWNVFVVLVKLLCV